MIDATDLSPEALARIAPGLTLAWLARKTGIAPSRLSQLARGRLTAGPGTAARITLALQEAARQALAGELAPPRRLGRPRAQTALLHDSGARISED